MKRILLALIGSLALVIALSSTALADDERFTVRHASSPDSGTCGNDWANDTFTRVFSVADEDGVTTLREDFKNGHFVTLAGPSPGACQPTPNGHLVTAGIEGSFHGFIAGTVTGGTFNPDATCTQPCNGDNFVSSHFGPTAVWNANSFRFKYEAHGNGLISRRWQNASADEGGNEGDIYTS